MPVGESERTMNLSKHLFLLISPFILAQADESETGCSPGLRPCFKDCCIRRVQFCNAAPQEERCTYCIDVAHLCGTDKEPEGCGNFCYLRETTTTTTTTTTAPTTVPSAIPLTTTTSAPTTEPADNDSGFLPVSVQIILICAVVAMALIAIFMCVMWAWLRKRKAKQQGMKDPQEAKLERVSVQGADDSTATASREESPLLCRQPEGPKARSGSGTTSSLDNSSTTSTEADANNLVEARRSDSPNNVPVTEGSLPESARDGGTRDRDAAAPDQRDTSDGRLLPCTAGGSNIGQRGPTLQQTHPLRAVPLSTDTNVNDSRNPVDFRDRCSPPRGFHGHDITTWGNYPRPMNEISGLDAAVDFRPNEGDREPVATSVHNSQQGRYDACLGRGVTPTSDDNHQKTAPVVHTGTNNPAKYARCDAPASPKTQTTRLVDTPQYMNTPG